jgi:hypothetical protein
MDDICDRVAQRDGKRAAPTIAGLDTASALYRHWTQDENEQLLDQAARHEPVFCPLCCFEVMVHGAASGGVSHLRVQCPNCGNTCEGKRAHQRTMSLRIEKLKQSVTVRIIAELRNGPIWLGVLDTVVPGADADAEPSP